MPLEPQSAILSALYSGRREDALELADAAETLTVWEAAALGRDDELASLIGADPSLVNAWAADGHTPLGLAAFFAGAATVRLLVDGGADLGAPARNVMKVQPLHAAVAARNADAVALLLDRGADPNARQQVGYTPLMGAASAGREDLVVLLLQHGADPAAVNDEGKTAADIAREHGQEAVGGRLAAATQP